MTIQIGDVTFVAFLLALVRSGAWIAVAPPFNHRSIPVQVRAGLAAALALALTPWLSRQMGTTVYDTPALLGAVAVQALAGAGLGVLVLILMTAVQSAGSMLDLFGGFSISSAYDPFNNAQAAIWGRSTTCWPWCCCSSSAAICSSCKASSPRSRPSRCTPRR